MIDHRWRPIIKLIQGGKAARHDVIVDARALLRSRGIVFAFIICAVVPLAPNVARSEFLHAVGAGNGHISSLRGSYAEKGRIRLPPSFKVSFIGKKSSQSSQYYSNTANSVRQSPVILLCGSVLILCGMLSILIPAGWCHPFFQILLGLILMWYGLGLVFP